MWRKLSFFRKPKSSRQSTTSNPIIPGRMSFDNISRPIKSKITRASSFITTLPRSLSSSSIGRSASTLDSRRHEGIRGSVGAKHWYNLNFLFKKKYHAKASNLEESFAIGRPIDGYKSQFLLDCHSKAYFENPADVGNVVLHIDGGVDLDKLVVGITARRRLDGRVAFTMRGVVDFGPDSEWADIETWGVTKEGSLAESCAMAIAHEACFSYGFEPKQVFIVSDSEMTYRYVSIIDQNGAASIKNRAHSLVMAVVEEVRKTLKMDVGTTLRKDNTPSDTLCHLAKWYTHEFYYQYWTLIEKESQDFGTFLSTSIKLSTNLHGQHGV